MSVESISSTPKMLTQINQSESTKDSDIDERGHLNSLNENEEIVIEPLKQNPYEVSYTCLLLPKFDSHHLMGDVVERLQSSLKDITVSFGWHLDFLSIKPDYLQWTIRVPLSTSTTYAIQVIRKQTSSEIFLDFPRFKRENQSDDFWAPGYLIFWGSQPHPNEIIQRYIRQTRRQQGIRMDD